MEDKTEDKIKLGRKPKFSDPEQLQTKVQEYFRYCKESKDPICITGLCVFLGVYRDYLWNLEKENPKFSDTIKRIKEVIAYSYEKGGIIGKIAPAQAIFLQKNMGFTDKTEIDVKHSGQVDLGGVFDNIDKE